MEGTIQTNVRCRRSSTHVNEVYAEQKIQGIFSIDKRKGYKMSAFSQAGVETSRVVLCM